jgi:hypothetical protein
MMVWKEHEFVAKSKRPINEEYLHTNVLIKHFIKYNSDDLSYNM